MKKIDFYTGFEGENVMFFREKTQSDEITFELELWYGFFSSIVHLIPFVENMHPDGLMFNWYNHSGFYNYEEWECKRIQELYEQLLSIKDKVDSDDYEAYNALKDICKSTIQSGNRLFVEYS
jgi:hypothetical protein